MTEPASNLRDALTQKVAELDAPREAHAAPLPEPRPEPRPDERRCADRVALACDVSLFSATTFWAGFSEDLSEGGLFVATYQAMPIGTRMDLQFELPTGHVVKVAGTVRWHRGQSDDSMPGMGISFEDLAPADLKVIRSFVKHRPALLWDMD